MYADDVCSAASDPIKYRGHNRSVEIQHGSTPLSTPNFLYDILHTIGQKTALDPFLFQFVLGRPPLRAWLTGLQPQ